MTKLSPVFIGHTKLTIPERTRKLLYVSDKSPRDISTPRCVTVNLFKGIKNPSYDEPSTIFIKIPITKPRDVTKAPCPPYYPAYADLTPEQKWIYLNWLQNLSQSIDIGYVFLYYCGLERHLLVGEFDLAVDEIIYLRKYHHSHSFAYYSNSALLNSCIFKKRQDRLKDIIPLLESSNLDNNYLWFAYHQGHKLIARKLINISNNIKKINRRYIGTDYDLFEDILNRHLVAKYGVNYLPFSSKYNILDLPKTQSILFANVSLPSEVRTPTIPNFFSYKPFVDEIESLFRMTHEEVKVILRERRRSRR